MDNESSELRWIWLGMCAVALGACVIEGEYLPDLSLPGSIIGAATATATCGDGVRAASEGCDDGNSQLGDGCDDKCAVEPCSTCSDDAVGGRSVCGPACNALVGQFCYQGSCVSCTDGIQNGGETDVDCGGGCGPCIISKRCSSIDDCDSGFCAGGVCCNETCDGVCIRCDVPGSLGICSFVPEGQTQDNPQYMCEGSSACDGKGACKKLAAESCAAGIECMSGKCVTSLCL